MLEIQRQTERMFLFLSSFLGTHVSRYFSTCIIDLWNRLNGTLGLESTKQDKSTEAPESHIFQVLQNLLRLLNLSGIELITDFSRHPKRKKKKMVLKKKEKKTVRCFARKTSYNVHIQSF